MTMNNTGNALGSSAPEDLQDNAQVLDRLMNGEEAQYPGRLGKLLESWVGVVQKVAAAIEEARKNLVPLSKQYMTLSEAQADIANIPDGTATYIRSPDDSALAVEYINNGGTLEATGRKMPSQSTIDALSELINQEIAKIIASGAAMTLDGYADSAWAWLDAEGHSNLEILSDGTVNVPALLIGEKIEFVQIAGGGLVCQSRDTEQAIFSIAESGTVTFGDTTVWQSDEAFFDGYAKAWLDAEGNLYRVQYPDGTIEDATDNSSGDNASEFPVVASVNDNIIAVQYDVVTQITNDSGVSNISPAAHKGFLRFISNISGDYLVYRASYDGKNRLREFRLTLLHCIIVGQSLAGGGSTITQAPVTNEAQADYGVVTFSFGPKVDFKYDTLNTDLLDSIIPCRENTGTRPGQESPSSGLAYQLHKITGHTVLVSTANSSGTDIAGISSGTASFDGASEMIQAGVALAESLGMDYQPVLVFIHGNQNAAAGTSQASYRTAMESLRAQYENVVNAATGGTDPLHMFVGQLSNTIPYGGTAGTTKANTIGVAQYQEARDNDLIHLATAQYARPYSDGEHLTSAGYRTEGEVLGALVGRWFNDNTQSSLSPVESDVVQSGTTITIPVRGCIGNLIIDTDRVADPGNYGFLLTGATIASVAVAGSGSTARIIITKTDSTAATRVSYAETGIVGQNPGPLTGSRGCIRDSQTGNSLAGLPLYNDLCVFAFQLS